MVKYLFTWNSWDIIDDMCFQYNGVEFISNFGVFKKGEKYEWLVISYESGFIEGPDVDVPNVKTQLFKLSPI